LSQDEPQAGVTRRVAEESQDIGLGGLRVEARTDATGEPDADSDQERDNREASRHENPDRDDLQGHFASFKDGVEVGLPPDVTTLLHRLAAEAHPGDQAGDGPDHAEDGPAEHGPDQAGGDGDPVADVVEELPLGGAVEGEDDVGDLPPAGGREALGPGGTRVSPTLEMGRRAAAGSPSPLVMIP
jgi:hypothetical protein